MAGPVEATPAQWAALWAAVDQLLNEREWVAWVKPQQGPDGVIVMGWPEYSPAMNATLAALGGVGAITPAFDWPAWRQLWDDPDGTRMRDGPAADAIRYLTSVVRGERFGDGTIDAAMGNGSLPMALARLRRWYDHESVDPPG